MDNNNNYQQRKFNYIPRQPIEIILNSPNGTIMGGTKDGHKFFELDKEITARKDENILLHLKKAFIPFSFYCISLGQKNSKLDITETNSLGSTNTYAITVDDGNYNISELLLSIKTKMESASTFDYVYEILYDDNTSKVSFLIKSGTNVANTKILWNTGTNKDLSLLRVLGFSADSDKTFTNSTTAVSDFVVDLADGLDSLHIKSNLVGDNIVSTAGAKTGGAGELLLVPVDLSPNSILYFDDGANPFKHQIPASSIKRIEINFTDNKDNVVDFNNIPYTLILIVEFIFDPNSNLTPQTVRSLQTNNNIKQVEEKNKQLFNLLMNKKEIKKNQYIL